MEVIGFSIMWMMAALQVLGVVLTMGAVGKPREPIDNFTVYAQIAVTMLFLYALVILGATR